MVAYFPVFAYNSRMKDQINTSDNSKLPITSLSDYIESMKKRSLHDLTTEELTSKYHDLRELSESRDCPYDDWMDLRMNMEAIDMVLLQRELDEAADRYTDADQAYDDLYGAAEWTNIGSEYE